MQSMRISPTGRSYTRASAPCPRPTPRYIDYQTAYCITFLAVGALVIDVAAFAHGTRVGIDAQSAVLTQRRLSLSAFVRLAEPDSLQDKNRIKIRSNIFLYFEEKKHQCKALIGLDGRQTRFNNRLSLIE